jgi:hypothetical protein
MKFGEPESWIACKGKYCKEFTLITHKGIFTSWKRKGKGRKFKNKHEKKEAEKEIESNLINHE